MTAPGWIASSARTWRISPISLEDRLDCVLSLPRVNVPPAVDVSLNPDQERTLRDIMERDLRLYASL